MKTYLIATAVAASMLVPAHAMAQSATAVSAQHGILPAATPISFIADSEISSKKVEVGDKFTFTVVNDVVEAGQVAIPRGSKVKGTVTWKTGKAIGGKSGKFEVTFDSVSVRGQDYALTGMHRQEGKGNTAAALLGSIFVSGRSAVMMPGQSANATTAVPIPY